MRPPCSAALGVTCRGLVALLLLALVLTGCTYSQQEPGLFPPSPPPPSPPASPSDSRLPQSTNPALPVMAETVWTTGEGLRVTTRFALHAVRRIPGATVLDWSITPLAAPGFERGDVLPARLDLGLTRETGGDVNIFLVDPAAGRVYRPLSGPRSSLFNGCLCSPLWIAQLAMRIGDTKVLQLTFPALPPGVSHVDVFVMNSLPFWHVPVMPVGEVPLATHPVDLARPAEPRPSLSTLQIFGDKGGPKRRLGITVDAVERSPGFTSVRWTLRMITDHPGFLGLPFGPPVSARIPKRMGVFNLISASGPQLRPAGGGRLLKARWMTTRVRLAGYFECLCTDLGQWASSFRQAGSALDVVTDFPAIPPLVTTVDVVLPGVGTIRGLPITPAADVAVQVRATQTRPGDAWTYSERRPPSGWSTYDWPTPLPDVNQVKDYNAIVEDLVTPPGW